MSVFIQWTIGLCLAILAFPSVIYAENQNFPPDENDGFLLEYQFQQGDYVHYRVQDHSQIMTRKHAVSETVTNKTEQDRHYRVVAILPDGNAVLELMIDRVHLSAQFDESDPQVFNSETDMSSPGKFEKIAQQIGKPLCRMQITRQGQVEQVQTLQQINLANDDQNTMNFLIVFPSHLLQVGDTWKESFDVEVPITTSIKSTVKMQRKFKLLAVEDHIASIELKTAVLSPLRDPAMLARLLQHTPTGTIKFDMNRGRIVQRELKTLNQVVGPFGAGSVIQARSIRVETEVQKKQSSTIQPASFETPAE